MIKKRVLLSLIAVLFVQTALLSSCSNKLKSTEKQEQSKPKVKNNAEIPTYAFYYAQWCPYCHKMAPHVKKASEEYKDRVFFYYVDVDTEEGKAFVAKYRPNGSGIPYSQFYAKEGDLVSDKIGLISYKELQKNLEKLL